MIDFARVTDPKLDALLKSEDALKHLSKLIKKNRPSFMS